MDSLLNIAETFGIPIVLSGVLLWYIQRLVNMIVGEMQTELRENFTRLESIIVKLIDNTKKTELIQTDIKSSLESIVNIFIKLTRRRE